MLVFLSWSGRKSKAVAELLKEWIPEIIQTAELWMFVGNEKDEKWIADLQHKLEASKAGILCLTKECLKSRWIYYEAGLLTKCKNVKVYNLLIDVASEHVQFPLAQFNNTAIVKEEIKKMFISINNLAWNYGLKGLRESVLEHDFENNWNTYEEKLKIILEGTYSNEIHTYKKPDFSAIDTLIGIELQEALDDGLTLDEITNGVIKNILPPSTKKVTPKVMTFLANKIKTKELSQLVRKGYIVEQEGMYKFTQKGKRYFSNAKTDPDNLQTSQKNKNDTGLYSATSDQLISTLPEKFQKKKEEIDLDSFDEIE